MRLRTRGLRRRTPRAAHCRRSEPGRASGSSTAIRSAIVCRSRSTCCRWSSTHIADTETRRQRPPRCSTRPSPPGVSLPALAQARVQPLAAPARGPSRPPSTCCPSVRRRLRSLSRMPLYRLLSQSAAPSLLPLSVHSDSDHADDDDDSFIHEITAHCGAGSRRDCQSILDSFHLRQRPHRRLRRRPLAQQLRRLSRLSLPRPAPVTGATALSPRGRCLWLVAAGSRRRRGSRRPPRPSPSPCARPWTSPAASASGPPCSYSSGSCASMRRARIRSRAHDRSELRAHTAVLRPLRAPLTHAQRIPMQSAPRRLPQSSAATARLRIAQLRVHVVGCLSSLRD